MCHDWWAVQTLSTRNSLGAQGVSTNLHWPSTYSYISVVPFLDNSPGDGYFLSFFIFASFLPFKVTCACGAALCSSPSDVLQDHHSAELETDTEFAADPLQFYSLLFA